MLTGYPYSTITLLLVSVVFSVTFTLTSEKVEATTTHWTLIKIEKSLACMFTESKGHLYHDAVKTTQQNAKCMKKKKTIWEKKKMNDNKVNWYFTLTCEL